MSVEPQQGADEMQPRPLQVAARRRRRGGRRPARRLDLRTRAGKRSRQLRDYLTDLLLKAEREMTPELVLAVNRAAELAALGEELRGAALRGRGVGADDVVRVERLSAAALRALRLPTMPSKQASPSLSQIIAEHEGAA
jgi:hypothetical protein